MEKLQHDDGMLWDTGDTGKKSTDPRIFIFVFHSLWQQLLTILISQHEQNDHKLEEQYSLCDGWNNGQTLTGIVPLKVILKSYKEADMSVYPWGSSGNHITQQPEARESESGQRTDWDKQTIQLEHRSHTGKEKKKRATALQFFLLQNPPYKIRSCQLKSSNCFICLMSSSFNTNISLHAEAWKEAQCYKVKKGKK